MPKDSDTLKNEISVIKNMKWC